MKGIRVILVEDMTARAYDPIGEVTGLYRTFQNDPQGRSFPRLYVKTMEEMLQWAEWDYSIRRDCELHHLLFVGPKSLERELPAEARFYTGPEYFRRFVTTGQAAVELNVSEQYVRRLLDDGTIRGVKHGNAWRIMRQEVERYRIYRGEEA